MFVFQHRPHVRKSGRPPAADSTAFEAECPRHGPSVFYRFARGETRCKRCLGEAVTTRHQKIKWLLVEEAGGSCRACGYERCIVNLQFHHVDPATKSFRTSIASGKSLAAYREEAKKCVLVWANCHGEIEAGLIESPPPYYAASGAAAAADPEASV